MDEGRDQSNQIVKVGTTVHQVGYSTVMIVVGFQYGGAVAVCQGSMGQVVVNTNQLMVKN